MSQGAGEGWNFKIGGGKGQVFDFFKGKKFGWQPKIKRGKVGVWASEENLLKGSGENLVGDSLARLTRRKIPAEWGGVEKREVKGNVPKDIKRPSRMSDLLIGNRCRGVMDSR